MMPLHWDWLTARPIAHRGLHNSSAGVAENSASAARAAIAGDFAIECDIQISGDGEAMVFHDFTLERLTLDEMRVDRLQAAELSTIPFRGVNECMPALPEFLAVIGGRAPLICEIKSRFDGDMRLAERAAACARVYAGPMALKSFDPAVIAHLRANRARLGLDDIPLGMIAMREYSDPLDEWAHLPPELRRALAEFLHWPDTQPDFLSWSVRDLPAATPFLCRRALGLPVITWTVRTAEQAATARRWADQMVFEGFKP